MILFTELGDHALWSSSETLIPSLNCYRTMAVSIRSNERVCSIFSRLRCLGKSLWWMAATALLVSFQNSFMPWILTWIIQACCTRCPSLWSHTCMVRWRTLWNASYISSSSCTFCWKILDHQLCLGCSKRRSQRFDSCCGEWEQSEAASRIAPPSQSWVSRRICFHAGHTLHIARHRCAAVLIWYCACVCASRLHVSPPWMLQTIRSFQLFCYQHWSQLVWTLVLFWMQCFIIHVFIRFSDIV